MDRVLIVDDSDFDRRMIRKSLLAKKSDISVTELGSGHTVVDVITRQCPKVTILDIRMPGLDGFDVLSQIRATPDLKDHPVLMVSGSNEEKDRQMARDRGANGYFVKPPTAAAYFSLGRDIYDRYLCCQDRSH